MHDLVQFAHLKKNVKKTDGGVILLAEKIIETVIFRTELFHIFEMYKYGRNSLHKTFPKNQKNCHIYESYVQ